MRITLALLALLTPAAALAQAGAGSSEPSAEEDRGRKGVEIVGHVLKPTPLDWTQERMDSLALPAGFAMNVFAKDLQNARMMRVADDGTVYLTRRAQGDVMMLRDTDGDGIADKRQVVAQKEGMHGIEIAGDAVYLMTVNELYRATRMDDGTLGELELVADGFPEAGQHPNRMVVMGPDGRLYISVGSTCNACGETDKENATIVSMNPDGSDRRIFASGLRNTIGYGFEPTTGAAYGFDHGIDWLGDNEQHEEFNRLMDGERYGWPYVYALSRFNPQDTPPDSSFSEYAAGSVEPIGLHTPHSAPMQLAFDNRRALPAQYQGDAFIALRGSWNRQPPSGYEVLRVDFETGRPVGMEPFLTGFLMEDEESPTGWGHMGRLAGLAQGPDGAMYLSDDDNGIIYRISYEGPGAMERPTPQFTNADAEELNLGLVEQNGG
ncbi:sorbosone dehydrogenase family protein [Altererythrobacter aurantiacus]|uniref:Sorbosone dehydrogenase family protein n=1 Tax=Parapontixanthobacter aurantiacus TaxID=1463599 RepID=A0A844ZLH3_9SPHN|nr:PQQ-dependent sugar dehydrogenase [Parapontixanthobacter aurantiacus]MXO86529.1 sorbosone dehydrogenase family protein [Parapontixanthobacter aurantiacus]